MSDNLAQVMKESALIRLMADLRAGRDQELRSCLRAMARFPRYTWENVLLIHAQRPDATQLAEQSVWQRVGRFIKDGEKGIVIEPPLERDNAGLRTHESASGLPHVFDVAQTDGKPLPPSPASRDPDRVQVAHTLNAMVRVSGADLLVDDQGREVVVTSRHEMAFAAGSTRDDECWVLLHQLAHQRLHWERNRSGLDAVFRMEAEADATAFVVSEGLGLRHTAPRGEFVVLYREGAAALMDSLEAIHDAVARFLGELSERQRFSTAREGANGRSTPQDPSDSLSWDR